MCKKVRVVISKLYNYQSFQRPYMVYILVKRVELTSCCFVIQDWGFLSWCCDWDIILKRAKGIQKTVRSFLIILRISVLCTKVSVFDICNKYFCFFEFHIGIQKLSCVLCCVLCKAGEIPIRFKDAEKCTKIHPTFSKGYSRKIAVQFFMKEYENSMEIYH